MAYDFARPLNVIMPELEGLITKAQADLAAARADLAKPIVHFAASTIRVAEGNVGTNTLTLTARRSSLSGTLLVPAAYIPGSAAPADFPDGLPSAKTFTFVDGSDTATVSIVAYSNTDIEVDKMFGYRLATGVGYRLGTPDSILVSILNDDISTPPVTLGVLTLSGTLTAGTASTGSILGATMGSTVSESIVGLSIDSDDRTYEWDGTGGAGTFAGGLVETHPNAVNSGRASAVTVVAAAPTPQPSNQMTANGETVTAGGEPMTAGVY